MIIWITGERNSGKTTLAKQLQAEMKNAIVLDGDEMRDSISKDLNFDPEQRALHNRRVGRLASVLEAQGFPVIVATICPDILGLHSHLITEHNCKFIHLS